MAGNQRVAALLAMTIGALLVGASSLLAAPVLYQGTLKVQATSGGACTAQDAGKVVPFELVIEKDGTGMVGYYSGKGIAGGRFTGRDPLSLAVTYPFADRGMAEGHRLQLKFDGDQLKGTLRERDLPATVDDCNYDLADLNLALSGGDAAQVWRQAEFTFQAKLSRSQGSALYRDKRYAEAVPLFQKALTLREEAEGRNSSFAVAYLRELAVAMYDGGQHEEAIALLAGRLPGLLDGEQRELTALRLLQFIYDEQKTFLDYHRYESAITNINAVLWPGSRDRTPPTPALVQLAKMNSVLGKEELAESMFLAAERDLAPKDDKERQEAANRLVIHAQHCERYRKFERAREIYQQALVVAPTDKAQLLKNLLAMNVNLGDRKATLASCRDYLALQKNDDGLTPWVRLTCELEAGPKGGGPPGARGAGEKIATEYPCNQTKKGYVGALIEYGEIDALSRKIATCYLHEAKMADEPLAREYPELLVLVDHLENTKPDQYVDKGDMTPDHYIEQFLSLKDKQGTLENLTDISARGSDLRRSNLLRTLDKITNIVNKAITAEQVATALYTGNSGLLSALSETASDAGFEAAMFLAGVMKLSGNGAKAEQWLEAVLRESARLSEKEQLLSAFNKLVLSIDNADYPTALMMLQSHDLRRVTSYCDPDKLQRYGWALDRYRYEDLPPPKQPAPSAPYIKTLLSEKNGRERLIAELSLKVAPSLVFEPCTVGPGADEGAFRLEYEKNRFRVCRNGVAIWGHSTNEDITAARVEAGGYLVTTRLADYLFNRLGLLLRKEYRGAFGVKFSGNDLVVKEMFFQDEKDPGRLKVGDRLKRVGALVVTPETNFSDFNKYVGGLVPGQTVPVVAERNGALVDLTHVIVSTERLSEMSNLRGTTKPLTVGAVVPQGNQLIWYDLVKMGVKTVTFNELGTITKVFDDGVHLIATDGKAVCSLDPAASRKPVCRTLPAGGTALSLTGTSALTVYDKARQSIGFWDAETLAEKGTKTVKQYGVDREPVTVVAADESRLLYQHNWEFRHYFVDSATGHRWRIRGKIIAVYNDETLSTYDNSLFTFTRAGKAFTIEQDQVVRAGISSEHLFLVTANGMLHLYRKDGRRVYSGEDYGHLQSVQSVGGRVYCYLSGQVVRVLQEPVRQARKGESLTLAYTVRLFGDGGWAVITPDGRFDTNDIERVQDMYWVLADDPLTPLPLEVFMKEYYEPRLLQRLLNGDTFKPVRDLMSLNRVLPKVAITSVAREGMGDTVSVAVTVKAQTRKLGDRERASGVSDLKLFRAGQLVGFQEGKVVLDGDGQATVTFPNIRLPRREGSKEVDFSAYAFNDDGVKSLTSRTTFRLPAGIPPAQGKAYLISIGVNRHQNSAWNLQYAAGDARKIRQALERRLAGGDSHTGIVSITLADEQATKESIKAVFDLLAGRPVRADVLQQIPNVNEITKATPEDLIIISFSGHGYVDDDGIFYTFCHDTGRGDGKSITPELLGHLISSDELSRWLRYVDAGDMAMIVDACHSAATVGDSFKPGPMGSRGLGQLAYDKGMRILAASQADDVALESDQLKQGLLTYTLVHDGLDAFQADYQPRDRVITLAEWLSYGVKRVPALYEELKTGTVSSFGSSESSRGTMIRLGDGKQGASATKKNPYQTPALFDFTKKSKADVRLAVE
ncbi:tetratricopeptide repeat protein [Geomonas paludis]|uniref:Tetratricopeptide repeat protein n=1 Tax=Geomonas paludis TaxID=2740185 RepID=A0ABY4LLK0_9BACT|nr:tetratricopeptide repeat protein [Geomonas paludis]UPU37387.1 tetratricopeptide repeat protein [Geomonas paludis]